MIMTTRITTDMGIAIIMVSVMNEGVIAIHKGGSPT